MLLILSDLHLEFGIFNVPKVDYEVVILAGDIFVTGSSPFRLHLGRAHCLSTAVRRW